MGGKPLSSRRASYQGVRSPFRRLVSEEPEAQLKSPQAALKETCFGDLNTTRPSKTSCQPLDALKSRSLNFDFAFVFQGPGVWVFNIR